MEETGFLGGDFAGEKTWESNPRSLRPIFSLLQPTIPILTAVGLFIIFQVACTLGTV